MRKKSVKGKTIRKTFIFSFAFAFCYNNFNLFDGFKNGKTTKSNIYIFDFSATLSI